MNVLADKDDILAVTRRVNGGTNGFADRKNRLDIAKKALGLDAFELLLELSESFVTGIRLCILVDEALASEAWDGSYCGKCHSTNIGICKMEDWLAVEERREKRRKEIEWNK